jgi:hypothetical protein
MLAQNAAAMRPTLATIEAHMKDGTLQASIAILTSAEPHKSAWCHRPP